VAKANSSDNVYPFLYARTLKVWVKPCAAFDTLAIINRLFCLARPVWAFWSACDSGTTPRVCGRRIIHQGLFRTRMRPSAVRWCHLSQGSAHIHTHARVLPLAAGGASKFILQWRWRWSHAALASQVKIYATGSSPGTCALTISFPTSRVLQFFSPPSPSVCDRKIWLASLAIRSKVFSPLFCVFAWYYAPPFFNWDTHTHASVLHSAQRLVVIWIYGTSLLLFYGMYPFAGRRWAL
jgi:hypothetical protein